MSISGITSNGQLSQVYGIKDDQYWDKQNSDSTGINQSSTDKTNLSQMGQMMSQLMQLSTTDQTKFKEVAQQISDDLSTKAQSASTIQQSQMLSDMSSNFAQAAQSGDMSSLKPKDRPSQSQSGGGGGQDLFGEISSTISNDLSGTSNAGISSNSTASQSGGMEAMGKLMKELSSLQTSDPAKFKQVTQQISGDLATQAKSATDGRESQMLSDMSAKFAAAAQSGDMSSLKPQGPPPPPPSSESSQDGQSGSSSASSSSQGAQDLFSLLKNIISKDMSGVSNASAASSLFASAAQSSVSL